MNVTISSAGVETAYHTNDAAGATPTDASEPSTSNQTPADCKYGAATLLSIDIVNADGVGVDESDDPIGFPQFLLIWNMPAAEVNPDPAAASADGPAVSTSGNTETFNLTATQTIIMTFGNADGSSDVSTYIVDADDFSNVAAATAAEVAAALQAQITADGLTHTATSPATAVVLTTSDTGPYASIAVTGTEAATLDFPAAAGTVGTYTPPVATYAVAPGESRHIELMRPIPLYRDHRPGLRSGFSYAITAGRQDDTAADLATASVEFRFLGRAAT